MHAVYCEFTTSHCILTKSLTFILKFGGDLNGKLRRRLGIETTRLDFEWPSRLFDLTAATLVSRREEFQCSYEVRGSTVISPSGSGRSPTARRRLVHYWSEIENALSGKALKGYC